MPYAERTLQRTYQREWNAQRRQEWFAEKSCELCGALDQLELDHVDPEKKVSHRIWTWAKERRDHELAKCQVLCHNCHLEKTLTYRHERIPHPSITMYDKGCRCVGCRELKSNKNRLRTRV